MRQYRYAQTYANLTEDERQFLQSFSQEPGEDSENTTPLPDDSEEQNVIHVYPFEGGGVVLTETPLEEEEEQPRIVESGAPENGQCPIPGKNPPCFLYFLLFLFVFLCLDSADTTLTALFSPTATITIIPQQQALTTTATFPIGASPGDIQGRILPALTLSQTQTVAATGRGHQDARAATGTLNFYNGAFSPQTVNAGTIYTGSSGVQVATDHTVTIPAASPPYLGQASVTAHAVSPGASGNIQAGDVSITTGTLQVKNSPFQNGQDARDFSYVQSSDIQQANSALTPVLLQSEQGALSAQLKPGETLTTLQCAPRVFSNHQSGDEAASVQVTVSETCKAAAYSQQSLQQAALQFVRGRLTHLNTHYQLIGAIQITIHATTLQNGSATLTALLHGAWVYQLSEEKIKTLVAGRPRQQAIRLLSSLPGVQRVSIAGIADNAPLPDEASHLHVLILVEG